MANPPLLVDFRGHFLIRTCPVPTEAFSGFGSETIADLVSQVLDARLRFESTSETLRDHLYDLIPLLPAGGTRSAALSLKRAAHSPEPILRTWKQTKEDQRGPFQTDETSACLRAAERLSEAASRLSTALQERREEEIGHLREAMEVPEFENGVRSSSPSLSSIWTRFLNTPEKISTGRREKFQDAIVGYLARAVGKTSPYSTFTVVGWGRWSEEAVATIEMNEDDTRGLRGCVRLNRAGLARLTREVASFRTVASAMWVRVNPTLSAKNGTFFSYQTGSEPLPSLAEHQVQAENLIRLPMTPSVTRVLDICRNMGPAPRKTLERVLCSSSQEEVGKVRAFLDEMIRLQLLEAHIPVPIHDPRFDLQLQSWIESIGLKVTTEVASALETVNQKLSTLSPSQIEGRPHLLGAAAKHWRRMEDALGVEPFKRPFYFEDVALPDRSFDLNSNILRDSETSLASLGKISSLFHPHYLTRARVSATLEALGGGPTPLLEVYARFNEMFRNDPAGEHPADSDVKSVRNSAREAVRHAVFKTDGRKTVRDSLVSDFLASLPAWVEEPPTMSFFLQRSSVPGSPWVCNLPIEGNGRLFSRFLHLFPELTERVAEHSRGSRYELDGELIDLGAVFDSNVNLHCPMTPDSLDFPGHWHSPDWAQTPIRDLDAALDDTGTPRLVRRRDGRWIRPAHFGFLVTPWLSDLARFLTSFGPLAPVPLPWHEDLLPEGFTEPIVPRGFWGSVMVFRKRWNLTLEDVHPICDPDPASAFEQIGLLRRELGIPRRVFVTADQFEKERWRPKDPEGGGSLGENEADVQGPPQKKPQLVDLTSPLSVRRLTNLLQTVRTRAAFEEVYPPLEESIVRSPRGTHATEILVVI